MFCLGRWQMTYLEEGRGCLGARGRGELCRLTTKLASSKTVVKDFSYTLTLMWVGGGNLHPLPLSWFSLNYKTVKAVTLKLCSIK